MGQLSEEKDYDKKIKKKDRPKLQFTSLSLPDSWSKLNKL